MCAYTPAHTYIHTYIHTQTHNCWIFHWTSGGWNGNELTKYTGQWCSSFKCLCFALYHDVPWCVCIYMCVPICTFIDVCVCFPIISNVNRPCSPAAHTSPNEACFCSQGFYCFLIGLTFLSGTFHRPPALIYAAVGHPHEPCVCSSPSVPQHHSSRTWLANAAVFFCMCVCQCVCWGAKCRWVGEEWRDEEGGTEVEVDKWWRCCTDGLWLCGG